MTFRILTETGDRILLENGSDFLRSETAATPFAGFKMTGPDCCCCRDILSVLVEIRRVKGDVIEIAVNSGLTGYTVTDYDYEAKKALLYRGSSGDTFLQFADMESASPWTLTSIVYSAGGTRNFLNAALDRRNSKVYFVERFASSPDTLNVIDYDGTDETYLADIDAGDGDNFTINTTPKSFQYQPTTDCLYYWTEVTEYIPEDDENVFHKQVRRVNSDGTGDTLVYQCTNSKDVRIHPSADGDVIISMAFDHVGEKLFVLEWQRPGNIFVATYQKYRIIKMDLDGTNQEVIVSRDLLVSSPTPNLINDLAWSHKNQLLYTFEERDGVSYPSDTGGGFFSYAADGSGRTQIVPRTGISYSASLWLWCGFEKTGTGTEA